MEEIIKKFYYALNRNDLAAISKLLHADIIRVEPEGFPMSGTYKGHEIVMEHFSKARETWAEGACSPEGITVSKNKILVPVHVRVRLKDRSDWVEGRLTDGFVLQNEQIIEMRSFMKNEEAQRWFT